MSHGHDPYVVGWQWPLKLLLRFLHAELRKQGVRTYKLTGRTPVTQATLDAHLSAFRSDLDEWEL